MRYCIKLRVLELSFCERVTNSSLEHLVQAWHQHLQESPGAAASQTAPQRMQLELLQLNHTSVSTEAVRRFNEWAMEEKSSVRGILT